jgi:predicted AAA+ superfamily ATPase
MRTRAGLQEIDLIVEGSANQIVALEAKLTQSVTDQDVKHLVWLRSQIGDDFVDGAVITTGEHAYRRQDGIAVIPAALLGP